MAMQKAAENISSDGVLGAAASTTSSTVATTNSETTLPRFSTVTAVGAATTTATIVEPPSTLSSQETLPPLSVCMADNATGVMPHVAATPIVDLVTASSSSAPPPLTALQSLGERRPAGILRLDMNKPRRSSGGSVEFRAQPQMLGEVSQ